MCQALPEAVYRGPQIQFVRMLIWLGFGFWERSKFKLLHVKIQISATLLETLKTWPSCKHLRVCACTPRGSASEMCPFQEHLPLANLQPVLGGLQGGLGAPCADTFSVNREAGPCESWCQALASPGSSSFSNQRG